MEVDHVRQREIYKFTTDDGYDIHFFILKECVINRNPRMEEFTELAGNDNQEIEVFGIIFLYYARCAWLENTSSVALSVIKHVFVLTLYESTYLASQPDVRYPKGGGI